MSAKSRRGSWVSGGPVVCCGLTLEWQFVKKIGGRLWYEKRCLICGERRALAGEANETETASVEPRGNQWEGGDSLAG